MDRYPKIKLQYEKLVQAVNHAEQKERDPLKLEYLEWLRRKLEAIDVGN